jgi:IS30 family transposase
MKKGKLTVAEVACIKGMMADNVSEEDMAKQLGRSLDLIAKETKRIGEEALREQMMVRKTAKGEGGIVAMTEVASMKADEERSKPAPTAPTKRGKWIHTIYDQE